MAYIVMAYIGMAYIVTTYIVMAYIGMAYIGPKLARLLSGSATSLARSITHMLKHTCLNI